MVAQHRSTETLVMPMKPVQLFTYTFYAHAHAF